MDRELVSIAILNYQRKDSLRSAIQRALAQDYRPLEVLVVDNASTDGSERMVREEFPSVRWIRLPENVGCAARNVGVENARGEIVLTLDNDVYLEGRTIIPPILEAFRAHPRVASLDFKILNVDGTIRHQDWCHPRDWHSSANDSFLSDTVLEGASAHRRKVFLSVGGYWPKLFIGHEGWDLALRLVDAGYEILYLPEVAVTHLASTEARSSERIYYTFTRNAMWVAVRNHRPARSLASLAQDLAMMGISSLRAGHFRGFARGLLDGVRGLGGAYAARAPLRAQTYHRLARIRASKPGLLQRARRHWKERPI